MRVALLVIAITFTFSSSYAEFLKPDLSKPEVRYFVEYYLRVDRGWVKSAFRRMAYYKGIVLKVLKKHNLPEELVVLPVLESGYRGDARSKSGAFGYWQFMRFTAQKYGLKTGYWIDERADIERSTEAAARYISRLYADLGNWELVLASYNGGDGYIKRLVEKTGLDDYWMLLRSGMLSRQVREFVPRFLALLWIYQHRKSLGFADPKVEPLDKTYVSGKIDLKAVAAWIGMDYRELTQFNAFLRRGMVPPWGSHIYVPKRYKKKVNVAYMWSVAAKRAKELGIRRLRGYWYAYVVRKGDSLWKISRKFGVDVKLLMLVNRIYDDMIRPGDVLLVPTKRLVKRIVDFDSEKGWLSYRVKKGDTIWRISKIFGAKYSKLIKINGRSVKRGLKPGEIVKVALGRDRDESI